MLNDLITWWAQQLASLLPRRLTLGGRNYSALLVDVVAGGRTVGVSLRKKGSETRLGSFSFDPDGLATARRIIRSRGRSLDILLRPPPENLLEHGFAIPRAAERDAAQVLRYEIDRITPFSADEVFWTWEVERHDRPRAVLNVRLYLVPQNGFRGAIDQLARAGIVVIAIEARARDGRPRRLPIAEAPRGWQKFERASIRLAAVVCILLALSAMLVPFVLQQFDIWRNDQRIAVLRPRVTEALALRQRLTRQAAGTDVVAAELARVGDPLYALAAITDALPDDTYLTAFSLSQRNIGFTGQSGDPARLISTLSSDPAISSPSFSSPVTTAPSGKGSLFSIRALLAP